MGGRCDCELKCEPDEIPVVSAALLFRIFLDSLGFM